MNIQKTMVYLSIESLKHHPKNPRKEYRDLEELAESIKAKGVMQNLTVVATGNDTYNVVIGNRRLEAAKLAGLETLPCIIAEMTEQEIISTMLVENIQRTDLTIYEQAQGFQLMLDIGETVGTIAEKTGFSETTIRRRVKLTEFDQQKLEKAAERQISLTDISKLNEIKSVEARNKLLDSIGTRNFEWECSQALRKEQDAEADLMWKELGNKHGLKKIKPSDVWSIKYSTIMSGAKTAEDFEKAVKKGAKFYAPNGIYCALCKKAEKSAGSAKSDISPEEAERLERKRKLEGAFKQAYELREAFVQGISNAAAKKKIDFIAKTEAERIANCGYLSFNSEKVAKLLGIEYDRSDESKQAFVEAAGKMPEKLALIIAYCLFNDDGYAYCVTWRGEYTPNGKLEKIYKFLENFGYKISDTERALLDGSSEMYAAKEDDKDDEDDDEDK